MKYQIKGALLTFTLATFFATGLAAQNEAPLVGDPVHGEKLFKKTGKPLKVDGNWINRVSNKMALRSLKAGKNGFVKVGSKNKLDRADVLAYLKAHNTDMESLIQGADTVLVSKGKLDKFAEERLVEAKLKLGKRDKTRRVFAFFDVSESETQGLRFVREKNNKARDLLKPSKKVGYVFFVPAKIAGEKYELGFAVDKDAVITAVRVRNKKNGLAPETLNQAASRFVGQGARGKYEPLRAPGAGRALKDIAKPLSDAYLKGVESVYMYEVKEREYFAFDEDD